MPKRELKKIIREYAELLRKNRIAFKQIYLFGSQALGTAHENSDIDIAVVMKNLSKGKSYMERKMDLRKLTRNVDTRIEPVLLEEKDLNKKEPSIMGYEVLRHGILVA